MTGRGHLEPRVQQVPGHRAPIVPRPMNPILSIPVSFNQPAKRASGSPSIPRPVIAKSEPRSIPSSGDRCGAGGHGRHIENVEVRAAEHHARHLFHGIS